MKQVSLLLLVLSGLTSLFLTGCAKPLVETDHSYRTTIPATLLLPCEEYQGPLLTNKDLVAAYLQQRSSIQGCNIDKASIKAILEKDQDAP